MSKYIPCNHKHLTAEDRLYIEKSLDNGTSFKDIARYLCKDPSTISKEVGAHRLSDFYAGKGFFFNAHNFCVHRSHCPKRMSAIRLFYVTLNVLPVLHVTNTAKIL